MTTPTQIPAAPPTSVPEQIQQHDLAALALETAAVAATAGVLRSQLQVLTRSWLLAWQKAFGGLHTMQSGMAFLNFMERVQHDLAHIRFDPTPSLLDYMARARNLGVKQGFRETGEKPAELPGPPMLSMVAGANQAADKAAQRLDTAVRMAGNARSGSFTAVTQTAAPAQQAANEVERTARTMTNTALNDGIADVAEHVGGKLLWLAERDACVSCLALSGHVVNVGDEFSHTATFGAKPIKWIPDGGLTGPPRHPSCRCRVSPWLGSAGPTPIDLPQALRREAERSVLKGWARPSESERVRRDAADRLLSRIGMTKHSRSPSGWAVPRSVKERAERALRNGTFTTGPVPVPGKK